MKISCIEQCQAHIFKKISGNERKQQKKKKKKKKNQHSLEENAEQ